MSDERAIARLAGPAGQKVAAASETRVPRTLDGRAKAAVVVRLLLNEGAELPIESLPEDLQAALTAQMGQMGLVDRVTLAAVVQEFAEALDGIGLSFPNGLAGALDAMDGRISPQTAARLRKEAGVRQAGDPWARLRALPLADLAGMVQAESTEVAAVLLSKLEVDRAAALLSDLPGPLARRIAYAISLTGNVTPDAVDRIGLALAAQLDHKPLVAFDDGPGERVGAILNQSPAATRDALLSALDETDADFAGAVRRAIFTFEHIPARLAPRDVPALLRAADAAQVVTALAGAEAAGHGAVAEFLLSNLSNRMADGLREEIEERGKVRPAEAEAAMGALVGTIRQLQVAGEVTLLNPVDEGNEEEETAAGA